MENKNIVATVSAFLLIGVLSGPGFAESALDQLKAQAESLGAATPVPVQAPAAAPVVQNIDKTASAPSQTPAAVPFQEPRVTIQERVVEDIEQHLGHFLYVDLFPHLEPNGDHHLEQELNHFLVKYASEKECDLKMPVVNLREIAPGVYRSGIPTQAEGYAQLKQMGMKTVVSLLQPYETAGKPSEAAAFAGMGIGYADIPVDWTDWPPFQQIDEALTIMTDPSKQPVLIHCTCGNDRTGIFSASYRVVVQGWTPEQAAAEAKADYWKFPAMGDLAQFLSSYARYRAGTVPPQPAHATAAK